MFLARTKEGTKIERANVVLYKQYLANCSKEQNSLSSLNFPTKEKLLIGHKNAPFLIGKI